MALNERERLVLNTVTMRLNEKESLTYLEKNHHKMEHATYYRIKARIEAETLKRINEIGSQFQHQHLARIEELELIRSEMWKNCSLETVPFKKVMILKEIKELQPFISAYHEATKHIMEDEVDKVTKQESDSLSIVRS